MVWDNNVDTPDGVRDWLVSHWAAPHALRLDAGQPAGPLMLLKRSVWNTATRAVEEQEEAATGLLDLTGLAPS
jgi:hypothetical protein